MALDLTTAGAILKDDYQGPIREQLNSATRFLQRVKRNTTDFVGKQAVIPLRKGRNIGRGARAEKGTLPTAGNQQYERAIYNVVYKYGRVELSGPTISAMKNNKGAFTRAIDSEMKGLAQDLKTDVNRMLWHDGSSILTGCGVTSNATTVVVDSTKFIEVGMIVDTRSKTTGALSAGASSAATVLTVPTATTFTVGTALTTAATDCVILTGSRDGTSWGTPLEMWGLGALVSDQDPEDLGTGLTLDIGQVDRTDNTWWKAKKVAGGAASISLDKLQEAYDESDIEGDSVPGLLMTGHGIRRKYISLVAANKRYMLQDGIKRPGDGGMPQVEFNDIEFIADKDASQTVNPGVVKRVYFLTMSQFEYFVLEDWQWMDKDGSVLSRVSNKDLYEATMFCYSNLGINKGKGLVYIDDLLDT